MIQLLNPGDPPEREPTGECGHAYNVQKIQYDKKQPQDPTLTPHTPAHLQGTTAQLFVEFGFQYLIFHDFTLLMP